MPNRLTRPPTAAVGARPPDRLIGQNPPYEIWQTWSYSLTGGWVSRTEQRKAGTGGATPPAKPPPRDRKVTVVCSIIPAYKDGKPDVPPFVKVCTYYF